MSRTINSVLVLGATGDQGLPLLDRLRAANFDVTAGVRRDDAFRNGPYSWVKCVHADLADEESLLAAFDGHDALAMHLPFEFDRRKAAGYGQRVTSAARRAGLKKIVFNTSCIVADHDLGLSAHDGRRDIETAIEASGVPFVIVRSVVFMDNIIRVWTKPAIISQGVFAYPASDTLKISWISLDDVAAYMVEALKRDALIGDRVLVGGPEALTGAEVAERLTSAIGRQVTFKSLTPDEYASKMSMLVTGSPNIEPHSIYGRMAEFYRWYNAQPISPLAVDLVGALKKLPILPTSLADWARNQDWSKA